MIEFEWDPKKAEENKRKHSVGFHEAATVFGDPLAITFADPDHSLNEERYITFCLSRFNQLLIVSHTQHGEYFRIINMRLMTRREKKIYEKR